MTAAPASGTPLVRWLGVLAAIVVLVFVLAWQRRQVRPRGEVPPQTAADDAGSGAAGTGPAAALPPVAPETGGRTSPEQALGAIEPRAAWREQIARAVRPLVEEQLGRPPSAAEEERLVDALASVGPAARSLDREMLNPDDPRSIARVREQTRALIEADRTVRTLLGIGVADLLRRLDPSRIDDQGAG